MCIIAYCPSGKRPTAETIRKMWLANEDGAGVMYPNALGEIEIKKGFMEVETLIKYIEKIIPKSVPLGIHFRIGTSGAIGEACTHPFPITKNEKTLGKHRYTSKTGAIMHNGIISWTTPTKGLKANLSDTMVFVKDVLSKLDIADIMSDNSLQKMIKQATTSKFLMAYNGQFITIGDFEYNTEDCCFYSNNSYKGYRYAGGYTGGTVYSGYSNWKDMQDVTMYDCCDLCNQEGELIYHKDYGYICLDCYAYIKEEEEEELKNNVRI